MSDPKPQMTETETDHQVFSVVVADDDDNVRSALASLLSEHDGLELAGLANSGTEAADLCAEFQAELAIVDVMMPTGGCEAAAAIHEASPGTIVVAYTARGDTRTRGQLMHCGIAEVYVKGGGIDLPHALYDLMRHA